MTGNSLRTKCRFLYPFVEKRGGGTITSHIMLLPASYSRLAVKRFLTRTLSSTRRKEVKWMAWTFKLRTEFDFFSLYCTSCCEKNSECACSCSHVLVVYMYDGGGWYLPPGSVRERAQYKKESRSVNMPVCLAPDQAVYNISARFLLKEQPVVVLIWC